MTTIKPFCALRPTTEAAAFIAALPYDVQSTEEAREIVAHNPRSFLAIDEPVVNFPVGSDPYDESVYRKAASLFDELKHSGQMETDETPSFYLYELTMGDHVQTGLVACVAIDDYQNGIVKEHENTRVDKRTDRINHINRCEAQTGPILLTYHHNVELDNLYGRIKETAPLFDFIAEDGVRHRGFLAPPEFNEAITAQCSTLESVYIADGHHRTAAAAEIGKERRVARGSNEPTEESDYFLAVLFADTELQILPYNRVVHDLNGLEATEFLAELQKRFDVELITEQDESTPLTISHASSHHDKARIAQLIAPRHKGEFCVFLDDRWFRCSIHASDQSDDPYEGLDVSIVQRHLFEPVLGITDPRSSSRIDFVGGIRGLEELERRCQTDCAAAFALYPTRIEELFAVADAGLLMPPKSTWFEPKLRSGLFIHEI